MALVFIEFKHPHTDDIILVNVNMIQQIWASDDQTHLHMTNGEDIEIAEDLKTVVAILRKQTVTVISSI